MTNNFRAQSQLVLSLFHGADLFGRGFEEEGFCIVRAAEIELGFDIRNFHAIPDKFDGIIAGTPCQDFSRARRTKPTGNGLSMLAEFRRLVTEAQPKWFLLENVPTVPNIKIDGYIIQRFDLNANECGLRQNRLRHFQFGTKEGHQLYIERSDVGSQFEPCCTASEGKKTNRRSFADFCELQGLPRDFKLTFLSIAKNYHVVGNGVPPPMARLIAKSIIRTVTENHAAKSQTISPGQSHFSPGTSQNYFDGESHNAARTVTLCACGCGRSVTGKQKSAKASCRKRIERSKKLPETVTL